MKNYYQLSAEETMRKINGSTEPLTDEQVKEHKEKYGPNELVEGKKKTVLQIFLEQYKDFLVIIINHIHIQTDSFILLHKFHCILNHCQCSKAQKIHFQKPQLFQSCHGKLSSNGSVRRSR